jgi:hypothetical protein
MILSRMGGRAVEGTGLENRGRPSHNMPSYPDTSGFPRIPGIASKAPSRPVLRRPSELGANLGANGMQLRPVSATRYLPTQWCPIRKPRGSSIGSSAFHRPCLAPDIVEALFDGRQPKGLRLAALLGNAPLVWREQHSRWAYYSE